MPTQIAEAVMEISSSSSATDWLFTLGAVLVTILCFSLVQKWANSARKPPSPPKLPIIGNLHQLGPLPHRSLWKLAQKYGPAMFLQLGRVPTVVVSSPDIAKQVLRTRDSCCCSRPTTSPGPRLLSYNFLGVAWTPYGDNWKEMRKLFNAELLSPKRAESLWHTREVEVDRLINSVSQASPLPVDLTEKIFHLVDGILGAFAFGKSYQGKQFQNQKFHDVLVETMKSLESFSAEDFFPTGGWILDAMSGLTAKRKNSFRSLDGYFQTLIDNHLDPSRSKPEQEDLVDVYLRFLKDPTCPFEFTTDHIKAMLLDTFLGGTDSTAITLEWTMSELMANPRVMKKLQAEVRACCAGKPRVERDDIKNLRYLSLVIKEVLRKHSPVPLLLPHETMENIKIQDETSGREYDIAAGTRIVVNVWGIGRDPKIWKDPEVFYPERFEDSEIELNGKHFELLPFGAGKRMCPGATMGINTAEFTLANMVYCFDWELPSGMKIDDLGLEEELGGLTAGKKSPLTVLAKRYMT